jgi:hypothetical protein
LNSFGEWEFQVDRAATVDAHAREPQGGADTCTCNGCRNFVVARDSVYPDEFLSLLESLGIDYRKDGEVYLNGPLESGFYSYGGWFHFVGSLDKTGDFSAVSMGVDFKVWLCRSCAPPLSTMKDLPRVQLEFLAEVPWVLDEDAPE